ncbi:hypothetical protein TCAP_03777 [Tolypocladium capitatum]|uniref:Uncharacterized protein n=1 Tax=Tolypocladium capitatum TaxID=45235 RepID=A0A2K3QFJ1_9HYPO|nr:hypothetical protein TCAP_03777 [Tolypocladium capitatum]
MQSSPRQGLALASAAADDPSGRRACDQCRLRKVRPYQHHDASHRHHHHPRDSRTGAGQNQTDGRLVSSAPLPPHTPPLSITTLTPCLARLPVNRSAVTRTARAQTVAPQSAPAPPPARVNGPRKRGSASSYPRNS